LRHPDGGGAVVRLGSAGCAERDRLAFPDTGPTGPGPRTIIDYPSADTTVQAGPVVFVLGYSKGPHGLDTLYFETEGGAASFQPYVGPRDSVRFELPITTPGLSGTIITVQVFGTARPGTRGETAIQVLTVQ
jgi:hypothetical protein